ncbi:ABC protein [Mycena venus]|uniref:ABC protein n=1 Tax=Mycena venus TaxID=2733690 RepID=A0A8H6YAL9_9AGAR|nr:ABC protein [Mycena venus]
MAESLHSCPKCSHVFSLSDLHLPPLAPTVVSSDILETNDPPLESQIPLLQDFISRGRARMTALDAEIALMRSSLDKLLEEKDELDVEIWMHEGSLSLLRRIPPEIMSHIFAFTLPPHHFDEPAPWTASAVCRRWREIVVPQRSFWTFIDYNSSFNPPLRLDHHRFVNRFRLNTQLSRSLPLPLNVNFTVDPNWGTEDFRMMHLLLWHAPRWGAVTISGSNTLYRHIRSYFPDQFPLLRELTIEFDYEGVIPTFDMFFNAPLLQRAVVNQSLLSRPLQIVLPWSQLLRYAGSSSWNGHLDGLESAKNLVDCCLDIHETSALPETPILLPRLLRLSLSNSRFLGCLETPALLELYCDYAGSVHSFLRQQVCNLDKLVMWGSSSPMDQLLVAADPTTLTRIVEAVPTITTLAVLFPLPGEFTSDFCWRPSLAPALEYLLAFSSDPASGLDQSRFVQAVESRRQGGRLKSVKLYGPQLPPAILDRIQLLRAQGMDFVVSDLSNWHLVMQDAVPPEFRIKFTN